jgi:NAD(P)-dependent dehydrogenase (short-subunit alcohol dehydrogenase family)
MLVMAGLATAYADRGARIVAVNPGLTDTDRVAVRPAGRRQACIHIRGGGPTAQGRAHPGGRLADPQEIARVVVFLASGEASYVTGVSITMDGAAAPIVV